MTQLFVYGANQDFLQRLNERSAKYLIVGGLALHYHVPQREADDMDILIEPSLDNARKVIQALSHPLFFVPFSAERLLQERPCHVPVRTHYYLDILTPPKDFDFGVSYESSCVAIIGDQTVRVASAQALMRLLSGSDLAKHTTDRALLSGVLSQTQNCA